MNIAEPSIEAVGRNTAKRLVSRPSLDALFRPRSVAIIGASRSHESIGGQLLHNVVSQEFCGPVYPVNTHATYVQSVPAYASLRAVPGPVDLAVIAVPRESVMDVLEDCGAKEVACAIVISAGFAELGADGALAQARLRDRARELGIRLVGPNCLGVLSTDPEVRLNANFARAWPPSGQISFCSQSGALGLAVLDYAKELGLGIRHFVSIGNKADVSTNDLLEYWENDDETRVILLYVESFGNPRRFLEIARRVSRTKPIVALKSGRSVVGARAASSHTGALAGADVAVDALLTQAGVVRVDTLEELFGAAKLLAAQSLPRGSRVGILTNAGGPAIIAADALVARGLDVPELAPATETNLRELLSPDASLRNPVDMIAGASAKDYAAALPRLLADPSIDSALVMLVPTKTAEPAEVAAVLASARASKPIAACILGAYGDDTRATLEDAHIPTYAFPEHAASAMGAVSKYVRYRARSPGRSYELNVRPWHDPFVGERWLTPSEIESLFALHGIPLASTRFAANADDAAVAAASLGFPVVLKVASQTIVHKTEVGGVALHLADAAAVRAAFVDLEQRLTARGRRHEMQGVIVQKMVPPGVEILVGMTRDPSLGQLIAFGIGGTNVEVWRDVAFRVAPLTSTDAAEMLDEIRARKLLDGFRNAPPADRAAIVDVLLRVSRLAIEAPEIVEMDINPLIAFEPGHGVLAVDARIRIGGSP